MANRGDGGFIRDSVTGALVVSAPMQRTRALVTSTVQTGISAITDVTGATVTFTADGGVYLLRAFMSYQQVTTAGITALYVSGIVNSGTDNANTQQGSAAKTTPAGNFDTLTFETELPLLTAGTSYTFKLQMSTSAGTITPFAATATPITLRVFSV